MDMRLIKTALITSV